MPHGPKCVVYVLASALLAGIAACTSDAPTTPTFGVTGTHAISETLRNAELSLDEEYTRIAREEIPGFAGYYFDKDEQLVVLLADMSRREPASIAAERFRARHSPVHRSRGLVVKQVRFDYVQLSSWQRGLLSRIGERFRAAVDIDEVANRVSVWIEDPGVMPVVRAEAAALGIPGEAVEVSIRPLPEPRLTLRDQFPTMQAGMQIMAIDQGICTLGFSAIYQGRSVFVTASHCTTQPFAADWRWFYQPLLDGNDIGWEMWDIPHYACDGVGTLCRWSDAAIVDYAAHVTVERGVIAWPVEHVYGRRGSVEIGAPPNDKAFIVTKWTGDLPVGIKVGKVGRTSGSTWGYVKKSCVSMHKIRCLAVTDVYSEGGDSGAAFLLYFDPDPAGWISLAGVLMGGPPGVWTETWFSSLRGLERELGSSLTVCEPGWTC